MHFGLLEISVILKEIERFKYLKNIEEDTYKKRLTPYIIILLSLRKDKLPDRYMYSYSEVGKLTGLKKDQINRIVIKYDLQRKKKKEKVKEKKDGNVKKGTK